MSFPSNIKSSAVLLAVLAIAVAAPASACRTIDTLPAVIESPGNYCFERSFLIDIGSASAAIEIVSSHVTVDFQGHGIGSTVPSGCSQTTVGVLAGDVVDVTLRNGRFVGFGTGIVLSASAPARPVFSLIEGMELRLSGCRAIDLGGTGSTVRSNHIVATGLGDPGSEGTGIVVRGVGNHIVANDVLQTYGPSNDGIGVHLTNTATENLIEGNRVSFVGDGGAIVMTDPSNLYRGNLAVAAGALPYSGGTDLGGND